MIFLVILRDFGQRPDPRLLVLNRREIDNTVLVENDPGGNLTVCKLPGRSSRAFANGREITNRPSPIRHMQTLQVGPDSYIIVDGNRLFLDGLN